MSVTLAFCSCRRVELLLETVASVRANLEDIDQVERIVVIDDNSRVAERHAMLDRYPEFDYVLKGPASRGHALSLNYLLSHLDTEWLLYWEDDCVLETRGPWMTRAREVLESNGALVSVSLDPSIEQDATCAVRRDWRSEASPWPHRVFIPKPLDAYCDRGTFRYESHAWPGFSLKPNLICVQRAVSSVGLFDAMDNDHMEYDYAVRCLRSGLTTALLEGPVIRDTGKGPSAYVLNDRRRAWE
jgi:hypothetical protein